MDTIWGKVGRFGIPSPLNSRQYVYNVYKADDTLIWDASTTPSFIRPQAFGNWAIEVLFSHYACGIGIPSVQRLFANIHIQLATLDFTVLLELT